MRRIDECDWCKTDAACGARVSVIDVSILRLLFFAGDSYWFLLPGAVDAVLPTMNVEYTWLNLAVAMADEAVDGALYLALVIMRGGFMPLPIHV
jgi:hypothetical protein